MHLIGLRLFVERPLSRVLDAQHGGEDQDFVQGPFLNGVQQYFGQSRVQRQPGHGASDSSQAAMVVDRTQFFQHREAVLHRRRGRWVEEGEILDAAQF